MIEVARIKKAVSGNNSFLEKVFSTKEIEKCEKSNNKFQCLAARFAAKEAFMKALGTGWSQGLKWSEIEILNDEAGKPSLYLSGKAHELLTIAGVTKINVSLSHLSEIASAIVILER